MFRNWGLGPRVVGPWSLVLGLRDKPQGNGRIQTEYSVLSTQITIQEPQTNNQRPRTTMPNLFEELAEQEIPPLPADFGQAVHQRVNRSLVALQILDLLWRGLPLAFLLFGRAVIGLLAFTFTGKFPVEKRRETGDEKPSTGN